MSKNMELADNRNQNSPVVLAALFRLVQIDRLPDVIRPVSSFFILHRLFLGHPVILYSLLARPAISSVSTFDHKDFVDS